MDVTLRIQGELGRKLLYLSTPVSPLSGVFSLTQSAKRVSVPRRVFGAVSLLWTVVGVFDVGERVSALHSVASSNLSEEPRSGRERPDISSRRAAGRCRGAPAQHLTPGPLLPHAQDITRLLKARGVITLIRHR